MSNGCRQKAAFGVRQLAAAFLQASLLTVGKRRFCLVRREQARLRKAAASCRTPKRLCDLRVKAFSGTKDTEVQTTRGAFSQALGQAADPKTRGPRYRCCNRTIRSQYVSL